MTNKYICIFSCHIGQTENLLLYEFWLWLCEAPIIVHWQKFMLNKCLRLKQVLTRTADKSCLYKHVFIMFSVWWTFFSAIWLLQVLKNYWAWINLSDLFKMLRERKHLHKSKNLNFYIYLCFNCYQQIKKNIWTSGHFVRSRVSESTILVTF